MKNSRGEENWASESIKENERRERGVEQKESIIGKQERSAQAKQEYPRRESLE
jgi:hypothetical protein